MIYLLYQPVMYSRSVHVLLGDMLTITGAQNGCHLVKYLALLSGAFGNTCLTSCHQT